ncbi:MAG: Phosphatidylglycerophosphate synthase PgsA [Candidatus Methanohalarchaeum thermophilum]|uniref:Phosphatidylglycerophosphate synthase PgsA n=1 Tax=Methanohalarchaeum thermophilum TaxID=1903181 RepID=A0A1Q6DTQ3_METT1|nr:MAG: Phosphatidylglycerophosphate synthase PgsA [Candidatus Methanohalarchaeum thermophilum]
MLNKFRGIEEKLLSPLIGLLVKYELNPNYLSLLSLIFSITAFFSLIYNKLLLSIILVLLNALMDLMDGKVARKLDRDDKEGDFLDHLIDRYADVFIVSGLIFSRYGVFWIGVFAILGTLLTSYVGTQAQAVGIGRVYSGLLGRADRLVLIISGIGLNALFKGKILGFHFITWVLILLSILGICTFLQRTNWVLRQLN